MLPTRLFAFLALALWGCVACSETVPTGQLPGFAEPLHYSLDLKVDPRQEGFDGVAAIRVRLREPVDHLWLHGKGLKLEQSEWEDAQQKTHPASVREEGKTLLRVAFGKVLEPQEIQLRFRYHASFNPRLEGLYIARQLDTPYAVSQMEASSARYVFPSFDEPRFKTPYDIRLEVPADQTGLSNAPQVSEEKTAAGWKKLTFKTTQKLPTYLVAFAVGPWDVVDGKAIAPTQWRNEPLPLRAVAPAGQGKRLQEVLEATPSIITELENYFAFPYSFGKLDLLGAPDFQAGAMENPGLVIYRDSLLLLDANSPTRVRRMSFEINTHELAHQWFGDTVTMAWWDDIWLNEAFATWLEGKVTGKLRPENRADLSRIQSAHRAMTVDSQASARRVRQPIRTDGDIEGAFDAITYQKGAAVLGMFESWIGEEKFRTGIREYTRTHAFGTATSDDLIASLTRASGKGEPFARAMKSFLDQAGVPLVSTQLRCEGDKSVLSVRQERFLPAGSKGNPKQQWGIPVCIRSGRGDVVAEQCHLVESATADIAIEGGCPDWYHANANGQGYYRISMAKADQSKLTAVVASLPDAEQLAYADMIRAGFERGEVDAPTVLAAMEKLSTSRTREVATSLFETFRWIRHNLATPETRITLDAFAARLYLPRLRELGYRRQAGESETVSMYRMDLVDFLARNAEVREVRDTLVEHGKGVLKRGADGHLTFSAANYDFLGITLAVTVQEVGAAAIDGLVAEIKRNADSTLRASMIAALGATRDPALGERVREFALSGDVRLGEIMRLMYVHQSDPANREAFWGWMQRRFSDLLAKSSASVQGDLPELASDGWCQTAKTKELADFFSPRLKTIVGGAQGLERAREGVELCSALRTRHGDNALTPWVAEQTRDKAARG
ncbi:M1 family metallopeptidase [Tahibacter amnicola]|uniref:Aminopeptidase n=1 Tax=Tahibacter amnicola TaxID=2976241 RepID=A0ABY6BDH4_9GAMM|nr:M1 family metallopeptidase [Tahibacter amnicola]UXI67636.1 M1 family metallopeptidase [Tahibacter amnicola]